MKSSNFQRGSSWHEFWSTIIKKKKKFSIKKAYHAISIYGPSMTSVFLMATGKIFKVVSKLPILSSSIKVFFSQLNSLLKKKHF